MLLEYFLNLPIKFAKGTKQFFWFWYVQNSKDFWHREVGFLKGIERDIGVITNLKLITQPIFGDYTYAGRVIGPIFRLGRVLIGFIIMVASIFIVEPSELSKKVSGLVKITVEFRPNIVTTSKSPPGSIEAPIRSLRER